MKPDALREFREAAGIPAGDVVRAVRGTFPGFDKSLLSKVEHSDRYGVQLRNEAVDAVLALAPGALVAHRRAREDRHKLPCRIYCRVPESLHALLQQRMRADGYHTMQDLLADLVQKYIERDDSNG